MILAQNTQPKLRINYFKVHDCLSLLLISGCAYSPPQKVIFAIVKDDVQGLI